MYPDTREGKASKPYRAWPLETLYTSDPLPSGPPFNLLAPTLYLTAAAMAELKALIRSGFVTSGLSVPKLPTLALAPTPSRVRETRTTGERWCETGQKQTDPKQLLQQSECALHLAARLTCQQPNAGDLKLCRPCMSCTKPQPGSLQPSQKSTSVTRRIKRQQVSTRHDTGSGTLGAM